MKKSRLLRKNIGKASVNKEDTRLLGKRLGYQVKDGDNSNRESFTICRVVLAQLIKNRKFIMESGTLHDFACYPCVDSLICRILFYIFHMTPPEFGYAFYTITLRRI